MEGPVLFYLGIVNLPRHVPPPWTVEELDACFVVTDGVGQKRIAL